MQYNNLFLKGFSTTKPWAGNSNKKALIFYHIPKCAGTSFTEILHRNFKNSYRFHSHTDWAKNYSTAEQDIALSGHSTLGAHELFTEFDPYYITFLRDPVTRILSHYRQNSKRKFSKIDLKKFAEKRIHNGLLNYLGCNSYELSLHRLIHAFDSFGIVESYSKSLKMFQELYNLDYIVSDRKNATDNKSTTDKNYQIVKEIFVKNNPDELKFYNEAVKIFEKKTENIVLTEPKKCLNINRLEKPQEKVSFFDPFENVKADVESLIKTKEYEKALEKLKEVPEGTPFLAEVLKEIYQLKNDNIKALFWAEKSLSEYHNVSDILNYLNLYRIVYPQPENYFKVLVEHFQLFEDIKSECPDSSLNKNLRTLAQIFAQWSAELFQKSGIDKSKESLLRHIQSLMPLNSSKNRVYWLTLISMILESFNELCLINESTITA